MMYRTTDVSGILQGLSHPSDKGKKIQFFLQDSVGSKQARSPVPPVMTVCRATELSTELQVMDTLAEIQERHEAVKELERSLLDLHQIFLDMAVLVEAQGEMLDNIEAQVQPVICVQPYFRICH